MQRFADACLPGLERTVVRPHGIADVHVTRAVADVDLRVAEERVVGIILGEHAAGPLRIVFLTNGLGVVVHASDGLVRACEPGPACATARKRHEQLAWVVGAHEEAVWRPVNAHRVAARADRVPAVREIGERR
jgi:hypothetical protein